MMERNIGKDEETLKFLNDLQQLDKDEIIECLMRYFTQLTLEANGDINASETEYMRNEFGRIKMTQVNRLNTEINNKKLNISDIMFQFLTKIENEDKLKNILIEKNWFMGSLDDDINKQCQCYKKDGKIFFKNYDGNVYELDLTIFSQFLIKN